ncbi:MAG: hypothetical protein WAU07_03565 [Microgenomates group bacterium]
MLNTQKLLYILPDLAYVAELLPAKKAHTFSVQSFRQINGDFIDDNEFIPKNIAKLFSKIDPEEYQIIIPDFLFTNTIVTVAEKNDAKIKAYLKDELLPNLDLKPESHLLEPFILTEFRGSAKVQLSALEKSLIKPLTVSADAAGVSIKSISPLSWTIKSLVSLEPSISIIQVGTYLYTAQHYIGIDMTTHTTIDEMETIAETIKTLKGAEPSIQTVYLLSNSVVEEKLKELLSDTLPLQQLVTAADADSQMPSYVQQMIEAGMQTFSISDYPVPQFKPNLIQDADREAFKKLVAIAEESSEENGHVAVPDSLEDDEDEELPTESKESELDDYDELETEDNDPKTEDGAALPKPVAPAILLTTTAVGVSDEVISSTAKVKSLSLEPEITEGKSEDIVSKDSDEFTTNTASKTILKHDTIESKQPVKSDETPSSPNNPSDNDQQNEEEESPGKINLSQFASNSGTTYPVTKSVPITNKKIIKNKSGVNTMLKMVFITLAVFFATVAVGVGVGLGILSITNNDAGVDTSPVVETTPSPEPSSVPSPSPSPEPEIKPEELSILVVNATTTAGYAGKFATQLEDAEVGTVDAGNASGEYEEGYYLLMKEENKELLEFVEEATELTVTFSDEVAIEDADDEYDAVLVLAE